MIAVEGVLCSRHVDIQAFKGNSLNNNVTGINRILNELEYDTYDSLVEDSLNWSVPVINFWPYYYPTWLDYAWWGWGSGNSSNSKSTSSLRWDTMDTVAWYCERNLKQLLTTFDDKIVWGLIRGSKQAGDTRLVHYKISANSQKLTTINNEDKKALGAKDEALALFYTAPDLMPTFPGVACAHSPPTGKDLEFAVDMSLRAGKVIPFVRITSNGIYIYQSYGLPDKKKLTNLGRVGSLLAFRLAVQANIPDSFQRVFPGTTVSSLPPFTNPKEYEAAMAKVLGKIVTLHYFPYRAAGVAGAPPDISSFERLLGVSA